MFIPTVSEFRSALEAGKWAGPGLYPVYFIGLDGEPLSFEAAEENKRTIENAIRGRDQTGGWRVIGCEVNWEDPALFCSHTNDRIESAYAEDEVAS